MSDWTNFEAVEVSLLKPTITPQESQAMYKKWAEAGTYDKLMSVSKNDTKRNKYYGLAKFEAALRGLFTNPDTAHVLDIGAGTGLTGELLREIGFKKVDALEPCMSFVNVIKGKQIYDRVIAEFIGGEEKVDIADNTYDAVAICGAFGPGHIPCSAILEMIRIVRPGGFIVNCMREEYTWTVPEYKDKLEPLIEQCEREGRWKRIKREVYPNHYNEKNGLLMVHQVC